MTLTTVNGYYGTVPVTRLFPAKKGDRFPLYRASGEYAGQVEATCRTDSKCFLKLVEGERIITDSFPIFAKVSSI